MVEEARRVLEAERRDVLRLLRKLAADERRARERTEKRRREMRDLIDRGQAADVPVREMAEALGITRQAVYAFTREGEEIHDA